MNCIKKNSLISRQIVKGLNAQLLKSKRVSPTSKQVCAQRNGYRSSHQLLSSTEEISSLLTRPWQADCNKEEEKNYFQSDQSLCVREVEAYGLAAPALQRRVLWASVGARATYRTWGQRGLGRQEAGTKCYPSLLFPPLISSH